MSEECGAGVLRHSPETWPWRGKNLATSQARFFRDASSLRPGRAFRNDTELIYILSGIALFTCLLAVVAARGAVPTGADPFEAQLAEGIKLLGEGRPLESVIVLNSAKQSAPQDARPYFYCGMALAQSGHMRDAASELGEAVHLAPEQLDYRVFQAHVLEQLKQTSGAQEALAVFQKEQAAERLDTAWLRLLADVYYRL